METINYHDLVIKGLFEQNLHTFKKISFVAWYLDFNGKLVTVTLCFLQCHYIRILFDDVIYSIFL